MIISREVGDHHAEGIYFLNLGIACRSAKKLKLAEQCLTQAVNILEDIGSTYAKKARRLRSKVRREIELFTGSSQDLFGHRGKNQPNLQPVNALRQTEQVEWSFLETNNFAK